ncbi:MAG: ABC transporter ATP-binding protein [Spirochaetes bacterium]|nr:MAG: ABC transporter ATP-binding protein [Spirochaetota bacterium]
MNAIEVDNLRRIYRPVMGIFRRKVKEIVAVDDISFYVKPGELFGILGPNGAGKTTTVKILVTILIPTSGSARIQGFDVVREAEKVRPRIGFILGGERGLYWRLSGVDNLRYFASLYHVDPGISKSRIPYLMELVGLEDRGKEKVEGYSRGMKQRLHIARALLHDPDILFLDEPSIGLDPIGAREVREVVRNLQAEKKTILLTTHYMFEADALCQRIAVINHGKIVALDTPEALKEVVKDLHIIEVEVFGIPSEVIERLQAKGFIENLAVENVEQRQVLLIQTARGSEAVPDILAILNGLRVGKISVREPTLEDAYVRLVGNKGE